MDDPCNVFCRIGADSHDPVVVIDVDHGGGEGAGFGIGEHGVGDDDQQIAGAPGAPRPH